MADSHGSFNCNQTVAQMLDDDTDRAALAHELVRARVWSFPSRDHPDDDPAPPWSVLRHPGHRTAFLVAGCDEIAQVLRDTDTYGNAPYRPIGGAGFMLAMDPGDAVDGTDLHDRQRSRALSLLSQGPTGEPLARLAREAVRQACVAGLQRDGFDLAALAEQAAVRFCGLWFGFAGKDHASIQAAAAAGYRALVHQIVGRHFVVDDAVLPQARQAMSELARRAAALIAEYHAVGRKPREVRGTLKHRLERAHWPSDVLPPGQWGLSNMGAPLLKRMADRADGLTLEELATVVVGLIAGTVGNVQASACLVLQHAMAQPAGTGTGQRTRDTQALVESALAMQPPVPFLPRRARRDTVLAGEKIPYGSDVILCLGAAAQGSSACCPHRDDLPFGALEHPALAPHRCIGREPARALVTAIVEKVMSLPSLAEGIDDLTGKPLGLERRWGFACLSYPFTHRRARRLAQQPLIVTMKVKPPVDEHAVALRRVIRVGAPRIEQALMESRHVHFAWFEFIDHGRLLVLHTVYDGDFDAYVQDFALKVDDLFDQLFEHIEGGPPLPVAEHPGAFVDVIRACNSAPAEGYFFSAYPLLETPDAMNVRKGRP